MSSANKTLKTSDISVVPYKASRNRVFQNSELNSNGIVLYTGSNEQQSTTASISPRGLIYRSIRHLYYSHDLPSLAPTEPISEQNYLQLQDDQKVASKTNNTLIYDNYLQSTAASGSIYADTRYFPTESNAPISVYSIPRNLYGEGISKQSLIISSSDYRLIDDGNGNVVDALASNVHAGNVIYSQGLIVITNKEYLGQYTIGSYAKGGIIGYILQSGDPGYIAGEIHGLIAAPDNLPGTYTWYNSDTGYISVSTAYGIGNGNSNTNAIISAQGTSQNYAALACQNLVLNGYSDWYCPSDLELVAILGNSNAIGGFPIDSQFWVSTQSAIDTSNYYYLESNGDILPDEADKASTYLVRAIRSF